MGLPFVYLPHVPDVALVPGNDSRKPVENAGSCVGVNQKAMIARAHTGAIIAV